MKLLTVKEVANNWGISERRVREMCRLNQIAHARLVGRSWLIPEDCERPKRQNAKVLSNTQKFNVIKKLKAKLDSVRPLSEGELNRLNKEFMIKYTYNSNAIEGSTLTLQETNWALQGITIAQKPLRHHLDALGHKEAFYFVVDLVKEKVELSENLIKQIHALVLMNDSANKGKYRQVAVTVAGASNTPPPPFLVQEKMQELLSNFKKWQKTKNIIELVSLFHLNFEFIHPFIDGNGRTGRLLINLILMQQGYPPIDIKFSNRKKYYLCFEEYALNKNTDALYDLIYQAEKESLTSYLKAINL